jgi:hypothetical protein
MAMLAMTILVYFWVIYWVTAPLQAPQGPTCGSAVQPSYLAHARPVGCLVWTVHGAFYVSKPRINPRMAMAIAMRILARIFFSPPRSH